MATLDTRRSIDLAFQTDAISFSGLSRELLEPFVRAFLKRADPQELAVRNVQSLIVQLGGLLRFISHRSGQDILVRVFNTSTTVRGTQHPITVVETCMPDQTFLFDTLRLLFSTRGLSELMVLHPIIELCRHEDGTLTRVGRADDADKQVLRESVMHWELAQLDESEHAGLQQAIHERLSLAQRVVHDFGPMRQQVSQCIEELSRVGGLNPALEGDAAEACALLRWLLNNDYIFISHVRVHGGQGSSRLGTLQSGEPLSAEVLNAAATAIPEGSLLRVDKDLHESVLHRSGRLDRIFIRRFDGAGQASGISYFSGLLTARGVRQHGSMVPLLRRRLERLISQDEVVVGSHLYQSLTAAFDSLPIEYLFNASDADLEAAVRLLMAAEKQRDTAVSVQLSPNGRSAVVLIAMDRKHYDESLREEICSTLRHELGATYLDHRLEMGASERLLLSVFLTAPSDPTTAGLNRVEASELEARLLQVARPWEDRFLSLLERTHPEQEARRLADRYLAAFPDSYQIQVSPEEALLDVGRLEPLLRGFDMQVRLSPDTESLSSSIVLLKLYLVTSIYLTDSLPVLQNFGLRVVNQTAFPLSVSGTDLYIDVFRIDGVQGRNQVDLMERADALAEAVREVLAGRAENDVLNRLVLLAGLSHRQVMVLLAYLAYARQIENIPQDFLRRVLLNHPKAARAVIELFEAVHDPSLASQGEREKLVALRRERLDAYLKGVESAAEDRVLRLLFRLVEATLRTNYFRTPTRDFFSIKLDSEKAIPGIVGLRPWREIFVYHPAVEGIHLRGGPTARGGLRWSDRYDDYRSEILDLMRTQMVKNTLIVPVGAKGGFILKGQIPREQERERADQMYQTFIRGLLDVTDNIVTGKVIHPTQVVIHDDEDPYLVVAADKGTAHLSDTANRLSAEYGFWLGDAFASGGSQGYDHKKEAITAKGAWECVKRHFLEMGMDPETDPITCAGIGDMSGDVFGNGMLLSSSMKVVAAFNHMHIFLDPNPDPARSFEERQRLFRLPRSSWDDYKRELISAGGGIFRRASKIIELTPEVRALLGTDRETMSGEEVVRTILTLPVDLLWNGGIGTYVKASAQTHAEVGDRVNDAVRVSATEVKARVIGEGGNLGFTQAARIEYARLGGRLNTDAVDNSGGVDMSDHEVNLKILFQSLTSSGRLSEAERNTLLVQMTGAVSEAVLSDNRSQSLLLSLDSLRSQSDHRAFGYLLEDLFTTMKLDRHAEKLPDAAELEKRFHQGEGLTRPELARLAGFTKMRVRRWLQKDAWMAGPFLERLLFSYFPEEVQVNFADAIRQHPLRQDIIATTLTSRIVDTAGITFFQEIYEDTGHSIGEVALAWLISSELLEASPLRQAVLDPALKLSASSQYEMLLDLEYAVTAHCRRTLQRGYRVSDPEKLLSRLKPELQSLRERLEDILPPRALEMFQADCAEYQSRGVPVELARRIASFSYTASASDIAQLKEQTGLSVKEAAWLYHAVGEETRVRSGFELSFSNALNDRFDNSAMTLLRGRLLDLQYRLALRVGLRKSEGSVREKLTAFLTDKAAVLGRVKEVEGRLGQSRDIGVAAITVMVAVAQELDA